MDPLITMQLQNALNTIKSVTTLCATFLVLMTVFIMIVGNRRIN